MDFEALRIILEEQARTEGLDKYEIYFTHSESVSTETLKDEISSFSGGSSGGISFRCVVDGHIGSAATELFTEEELRGLVSRAKVNAAVIENEDLAIIFSGSDSYESVEKKDIVMPSALDIKALALKLQSKTYSQSESVTDGTQSGVFAEKSTYELANSEGLRLSNTVGVRGAYVQAVVSGESEAQEAFDFCLGFEDSKKLPENAVKEAISKLGSSTVASGKYKILLDGKQMRGVLSAYSSVFSGKNALLGLSLLAGKEGKQIASDCVTLVDDPLASANPVPTPFDGEGVATYRKNVIEHGVLKTLLYDLANAHKAGVISTGNGQRGNYAQQVNIAPFCFYIQEGSMSLDGALKKIENGLYVTELKGLHAGANAVTGDFSIESAGYLIEDGKITKPIKGFTVAGNFFDLLRSIEAVCDTVKFGLPSGFTTFGSPDVILSEMSVAGVNVEK